MKVFVLIKQVPATDNVKMDPETGTMVRSGKGNIINPLDENALEEAIRIKSAAGASVTAISMGPDTAVKALKEAVAMGADRGVLLSARAFAGSDTIATARTLAAAIKKLGGADLILCGERATDGETGQTGAMLACMLDIPAVTYAKSIVLDGEKAAIRVERIVEDGFERVEVPLPVLVTVVKDINEPGFPTLKGKLDAANTPIDVWGPEELGIDKSQLGLGGSPTRVVKVFSPKLSRDTVIFQQDGTGEAVDNLLTFLKQKDAL